MGCATSKKKERLCYNCKGPCSPPLPWPSYSVHSRHLPPCSGEVHHHIVSLTSSSLEPLKIESFRKTEHKIASFDDDVENRISDEKRVGLIEAKMWSKMIDERIPKILPRTPVRTPPGEPENINAWELMEGLEDVSPLRPVNHLRSFSFHFGRPDIIRDEIGEKEEYFSKPLWLELANREIDSKSLELDPSIISTFREALGSPNKEISENKRDYEDEVHNGEEIMINGEDLEKEGKGELFEREKNGVESVFYFKEEKKVKNKVVLYFTSLRGVRKTYEDCCHIRAILKSIGVKLDERDVSMHSGFKEELKELLGDKFSTSPLPRVFFGDNYIGGADEIRQMHEEGRLERMLLDCGDMAGDVAGICETCGDVRFVPCERCYGSCKIYYDHEHECDYDDDEDDDYEYEAKEFDENDYGFQRCPYCNENGLVRCPICCD